MGAIRPDDYSSGLIQSANFSWLQGFHDIIAAKQAAFALGMWDGSVFKDPVMNYLDFMTPGYQRNTSVPGNPAGPNNADKCSFTTTGQLSGTGALVLGAATSQGTIMSCPFFRVTEGLNYILTVRAKMSNAAGTSPVVGIAWFQADQSTFISASTSGVTASTSYQTGVKSVVAPADARWAYIWIENDDTNYFATFDQVTLSTGNVLTSGASVNPSWRAYFNAGTVTVPAAVTIPPAGNGNSLVDFDTHSGFSTATGKYTVAIPGTYCVYVHAFFTSTALAGINEQLAIFKSGTAVALQQTLTPNATAQTVMSSTEILVRCAIGDTLWAEATSGTAGQTLNGQNNATYVEGFMLP